MEKIKLKRIELLKAYEKLEVQAQFDLDFILLTAAAAAICAFGFRMNSPSVIVGAMVISPLLLTIVAIGASLYLGKWKKLLKNLSTLLCGILIAASISFLVNIISPTETRSEIVTRILSDPADYFFVAFFSGLAGTFAFFWPGIVEAITGIAISVALIPPVVMTGIGLAKWQLPLFTSSLEIVLINICGIIAGSFIVVTGLNLYSRKFADS